VEGASGGGDGLRRRQLLGAGGAGGGRLLLASAAKDELACAEAAATCSVGSEPFWSSLAIIQVGGQSSKVLPGDAAAGAADAALAAMQGHV
jgi:hypothetical protein